jgi:hypothetical protein
MTVIIKSLRIRSKSGISRIILHLKNGNENEEVAFLRGTPADIRDMQHDAMTRSTTYSVRHWIIAPHEATTRPQMRHVLVMLAKEFGFDAGRAVVVEHCKKRATADASDVHWHVLVGEIDPATGRILRTSFDRIIHELVARMSEYSFGHAFVQGKHTKTVIKGLRKRNLGCIADSLETFVGTETTIPMEAFTHAQHQEKKRLGLDLPALRQAVKNAVSSAKSRTDLTEKLQASDMTLMSGDKPNTWIVCGSNGVLVGALHRLAGWRKSEVNSLLAEVETIRTAPFVKAADRQTKTLDVPGLTLSTSAEGHAVTASSIESMVASEIKTMEMAAHRDLEQAMPMFIQTSSLKSAKTEVRATTEKLAAASTDKWRIQEQLWKAPQARWWTYIMGLSARRQRQIQELETALQSADARLHSSRIALSAAEAREVREERLAIQQHHARIKEIAASHKAAHHTLRLVAAAAVIMEEKKDPTRIETDVILTEARKRMALQDANLADQSITDCRFTV